MKLKKSERILLDPGYRQAYQPVDTESPISKSVSKLSKLKRGQIIQAHQVHVRKHPSGLSEAQLLHTLTESGIGRPSTYAEISGDLLRRGYVRQDGKQLIITVRGQAVQAYLSEAFPQIFALDFSADLERKLHALAQGKASYRAVVGSVWVLVENA